MVVQPEEKKCPLCGSDLGEEWTGDPLIRGVRPHDCPNCGHYYARPGLLNCVSKETGAHLSHRVWLAQNTDGDGFIIKPELIDAAEKEQLPNPSVQLELFILYLGDAQGNSPGQNIAVDASHMRAKIGASVTNDVGFINLQAFSRHLVDSPGNMDGVSGRLTLDGWELYEKLKRGYTQSRTAFMAMPFDNETVINMVDSAFREAVRQTGFHLQRVDDEPRAGLIDDKIRVDIRQARFVIVDLTNENRGAYWEAGYAEGLGKDVIYTCEKAWFEANGTHFDTNHHHTIKWDASAPEQAARDLKSTIRATLPFEAKMEDLADGSRSGDTVS